MIRWGIRAVIAGAFSLLWFGFDRVLWAGEVWFFTILVLEVLLLAGNWRIKLAGASFSYVAASLFLATYPPAINFVRLLESSTIGIAWFLGTLLAGIVGAVSLWSAAHNAGMVSYELNPYSEHPSDRYMTVLRLPNRVWAMGVIWFVIMILVVGPLMFQTGLLQSPYLVDVVFNASIGVAFVSYAMVKLLSR